MIPGGRWPSACVLFLVLASMPLGRAAHAKDKKGKAKPKEAAATAATPGGQRFTVDGVREPSGIAVGPGRKLFVVGDEGTVAELSADGRTVRVDRLAANLEDVAFHAPSGMLVLLVEQPPALVVFDPASHAEKRRIPVDVAGLLGHAPESSKRQGFEGLAFRAEAGRPGSGIFYLAHQRSPAMVVRVAFDPLQAASVGKESVVDRRAMAPYRHLTAISPDGASGGFLLIADGGLVRLGPTLEPVGESAPLPVPQPEGVCLDESGALWIADDPTGLVRFAAGPSALSGASGGPGGPGRHR